MAGQSRCRIGCILSAPCRREKANGIEELLAHSRCCASRVSRCRSPVAAGRVAAGCRCRRPARVRARQPRVRGDAPRGGRRGAARVSGRRVPRSDVSDGAAEHHQRRLRCASRACCPARSAAPSTRVVQPLPFWGKRDLKRDVAEADAEQAQGRVAVTWSELAASVKTSYARYYLAVHNELLDPRDPGPARPARENRAGALCERAGAAAGCRSAPRSS